MEITIEYCVTCNYRPMAAALAIRISEAAGIKPMLVPSNVWGAFEIKVNGGVIFSKLSSGMFPDQSTVEEILRSVCEKPGDRPL